jgi:5-methylcytosine-specific restriction protein A
VTLTIRDLPRAEWEALRVECFDRDDWTCVRCGDTEELQADHVRPIALYPELALDLANLQTLCGPCNRRKSDIDDGGPDRLPWLNPAYAELRDLVFSDRTLPARSLVRVPHTEPEESQGEAS